MQLSEAQVKRFWRDWSAACKAQGWTRDSGMSSKQIDSHRKDLLKRAGFGSLTHVDRTVGFGRVLAELGLLLTKVTSAIEHDHPEIDAGRRKRWVIRNRILPCLGVYVRDPEAYMRSVLRDKFDWRRVQSGYALPLLLDDLTDDPVFRNKSDGKIVEQPSQLDQVMYTLGRIVQKHRKEAGHSMHDMRIAAQIPCRCDDCISGAVSAPEEALCAAGNPDPDNEPF